MGGRGVAYAHVEELTDSPAGPNGHAQAGGLHRTARVLGGTGPGGRMGPGGARHLAPPDTVARQHDFSTFIVLGNLKSQRNLRQPDLAETKHKMLNIPCKGGVCVYPGEPLC